MNARAGTTPLRPTAPHDTAWRDAPAQGVRYGFLGLPLAFVALPLYVLLPAHYASAFGVPLSALGAVLLAARLVDAFVDPWIGRGIDTLFQRSAEHAWRWAAIAGVVLAAGFAGLFFPPWQAGPMLLAWCAALLVVTYLAYSAASVTHQAWGAMLGGGETQRARIVGWREAFALAGVLSASVLPSVAGLGGTVLAFVALLVIGLALLRGAPAPAARAATTAPLSLPWQSAAFRRLLIVFVLNGIASAVPATLVLFFVRDRLDAAAWEPTFLFAYFAAAAFSVPLWVRAVHRFGLSRSWLAAMLLAVAAFVWAALRHTGDVGAFAAVCIASGIALGADLTLPGALLAGVIRRAGHQQHAEGAYFGWWNFAAKLNLALAAGLALPMLQAFGYTPGARDPAALDALAIAYCLLPCLLKLAAAAALYLLWMRGPHHGGDA